MARAGSGREGPDPADDAAEHRHRQEVVEDAAKDADTAIDKVINTK